MEQLYVIQIWSFGWQSKAYHRTPREAYRDRAARFGHMEPTEIQIVPMSVPVDRVEYLLTWDKPHICANFGCHNGVTKGGDFCKECGGT